METKITSGLMQSNGRKGSLDAAWDYMKMNTVYTEKFRAQMLSGKYNKIAIGYAEGITPDPTAYAPYDPISSPTSGGEVTFNYPGVFFQSLQERGLKVVSYPKKTEYKVGEGFDITGFSMIWFKYGGGNEDKDFTDRVTFYTSKTVKLTQGRPFTTPGKKVIELRTTLSEKPLGTYTITVTE